MWRTCTRNQRLGRDDASERSGPYSTSGGTRKGRYRRWRARGSRQLRDEAAIGGADDRGAAAAGMPFRWVTADGGQSLTTKALHEPTAGAS
jgi:hypothetical protein